MKTISNECLLVKGEDDVNEVHLCPELPQLVKPWSTSLPFSSYHFPPLFLFHCNYLFIKFKFLFLNLITK